MKQSRAAKALWGGGVLGIALLSALPADAHRRDFPNTYDWRQPSKGEMEIESNTQYKGGDNSTKQALEFEYGVTDRFAVAPYVVFEREAGGNLRYHEWKVETRYQLGKYKTNRILTGLYLEYAQERSEDGKKGAKELEGKIILSRYDRHGGDLSLNLVAEHILNADKGEEDWEKKYSFGYVRPLGHNRFETRGGFEWIHNLTDREINAGPVLAFAPAANTWVTMGVAFPLNKRGEGNGTQLRLLAEYEF
jgi:hypothetical protein